MKRLAILSSVLFMNACEVKLDDLHIYIAEVRASTPVSIEPYPEFKSMPVFVYSASELRSPFQAPRTTGIETRVAAKANCTQPDFKRSKQALEKFGADALSVKGFFTADEEEWAIIQSNKGNLFKVAVGDYLGLFFGQINSIKNGVVSYTEMLPDGAGCWQKKHAKLIMVSKAGEKNV
ncbi:MAG: type IV pilus assembly protein PilP [Paraglaciecola sp.]|jgi:type IV pilus assembly protein PilP